MLSSCKSSSLYSNCMFSSLPYFLSVSKKDTREMHTSMTDLSSKYIFGLEFPIMFSICLALNMCFKFPYRLTVCRHTLKVKHACKVLLPQIRALERKKKTKNNKREKPKENKLHFPRRVAP